MRRFLVLLVLAACGRSQPARVVEATRAAVAGETAQGAPEHGQLDGPVLAPGKDYGHAGPATKVTMARQGCAQGCPGFDVAIGGDGTVTWEGHEHVVNPGIRVRKLPPEDVELLVKEFAAVRFDEKADVTCRRGGAVTVVQFAQAGIAKKVTHEQGCAGGEVLARLEDRIEDLAGVRDWIAPPAGL